LDASAGGGGGPGPVTPGDVCNQPEDCGSLPIVSDVHGLTFVGPLRELRALAITLRGRGQIDVSRLGGRLLAVTLVGDYAVELDRAALAGSNVGCSSAAAWPSRAVWRSSRSAARPR